MNKTKNVLRARHGAVGLSSYDFQHSNRLGISSTLAFGCDRLGDEKDS